MTYAFNYIVSVGPGKKTGNSEKRVDDRQSREACRRRAVPKDEGNSGSPDKSGLDAVGIEK